MDKKLLYFLQRVGLLDEVPPAQPPKGKPLIHAVCPLHEGADNPNAFLLFADGYACQTHKCHTDRRFGNNLYALIRHLAYAETGDVMNWHDAWRWAKNNIPQLKARIGDKKARKSRQGGEQSEITWTRKDLLGCLEIPSRHYLDRGYRPETLQHFGVGTCVRPLPDGNDRLLGWAVIPVFDRPHLPPLGYMARNPNWVQGGQWPKWMCPGFKKSECLFNLATADHSKGPLIICEGPGCVMRFYEAGFPGAVATFGVELSDRQFHLIVCALYFEREVVIAADSDEAGRHFAEKLERQLGGVCDPRVIFPQRGKDFGDATADEVRHWLGGQAA